jgi:hypothetical protein
MTSVLSASGSAASRIEHASHLEIDLRSEAGKHFHHPRVQPLLIGVQGIPTPAGSCREA